MNWNDLRYFTAFCTHGSLLAAARALRTEHATVARRIDALEQSLGLKLIDRRGRKLLLTLDGERVAELSRQMERQADRIGRMASGARQQISGTVSLSVPPALGAATIAPAIASLSRQHPALSIHLLAETRQAMLQRREADIAIRLKRPDQGDLIITKLMDIAFRPYCSAAAQNKADDEMQLIGSEGDMRESPQQEALARLFPDAPYAFRSSDVSIQMALAQAGGGIAMLPDFLQPEKNGLTTLLPDHPPLMREAWLVVHSDLRNAAPVRAVIDHLRQMFGHA